MSIAFPVPLCLVLMAFAVPQSGEVPADVRGFRGQVMGVVTARHDDGTFSFRVSSITRVWKGNEASNLEWFLGRTIRIGPRWVQGDDQRWRKMELHERFIGKLREQEACRLEIQHAERDRFAILELSDEQRSLARGAPAGQLATEVRGFSGQVAGIVRTKHDDGTFLFEVVKVLRVWKGSKAQRPETLAGTTVRVHPRWVKGEDGKWHPQELHVAFVRKLKRGEDYRLEIQNAEADHFQILELSQEQRDWAREGAERRRERE